MSSFVHPLRFGEPDEVRSAAHERVFGLRGEVHPDGGAVTMKVQFTNQKAFSVLIPFLEMPAIFHEFQVASAQMVTRQSLYFGDGGSDLIQELCRLALRPIDIYGSIDRYSGDRTYVMQFSDHAPLAIRIAPVMSCRLRAHMEKMARLQAN